MHKWELVCFILCYAARLSFKRTNEVHSCVSSRFGWALFMRLCSLLMWLWNMWIKAYSICS